jgi:bacteriocin resistance YdeI/OmpD-like protein/uncharacterized protein DUF1905
VQTTLHKMAGGYMMAVNAELRRVLGVDAGDTVQVSAEPDDAPRQIELPPDLAAALDAAGHTTTFETLTAFRQTEIVKSVNGAKQPQTRARRIAAVLTQLKQRLAATSSDGDRHAFPSNHTGKHPHIGTERSLLP